MRTLKPLLLTLVVHGLAAQAPQDPSAGLTMMIPACAALRTAGGGQDFAVDAQLQTKIGKMDVDVTIQFAALGTKLRSQFSLADAMKENPAASGMMKAMGLDQIILLHHSKTEIVRIVLPGMKAVIEVPGTPRAPRGR